MNSKEFLKALNEITKEKNIDPEVVYDLSLIHISEPTRP